MSLPAYSRARALAAKLRQTMPEDAFQALCLYNAESHGIVQALEADPEGRTRALQVVGEDRDALRSLLTADDYRYFEFQLWQEGVARFIQYAVARAAATGEPSAAFRRLPDYEPYGQAAEAALRSLRRELAELDLARQRRVAFYPIGAALALLLDETGADWKREYTLQPFKLPDLPRAGG